VDKCFDNIKTDMDKRFEQIIASIDRLGDKLERRDENQRPFTLRMFTIAIGISVIGALGTFLKSLGVFERSERSRAGIFVLSRRVSPKAANLIAKNGGLCPPLSG
jgi:hypothetical protein